MELNTPFVNSFIHILIVKLLQFCATIAEHLPLKGRHA